MHGSSNCSPLLLNIRLYFLRFVYVLIIIMTLHFAVYRPIVNVLELAY